MQGVGRGLGGERHVSGIPLHQTMGKYFVEELGFSSSCTLHGAHNTRETGPHQPDQVWHHTAVLMSSDVKQYWIYLHFAN